MGKISRIQLRGISRTPSDRLTNDGGCDESLNVCLEDTELVPVLKPTDKTSSITEGTIPANYDIIFLHKAVSTENYILTDGLSVGYFKGNQYREILPLDGNSIKDITSIGNTLIVATSSGMRYVLWKNDDYKFLGDRIPEPKINFKTIPTADPLSTVIEVPINDAYDREVRLFSPEEFNQAIKDERAGIQNEGVSALRYVHSTLWNGINMFVKEQKASGIMTSPFFVRYALKLFDGSYIYQSVPILLGAGYDRSYVIEPERYTDPLNVVSVAYFKVQLPNHFKAKAVIENWDIGEWADIIESIDVFASVDVNYPVFNSKFSEIRLDGTTADGKYYTFDLDFFHEGTDEEALERELLNASLFYKIEVFKQDDIADLKYGVIITDDIFLTSQDQLVAQERLPDYEQSGTAISPEGFMTYNGRVVAFGGSRTLTPGHAFLQSTNITARRTTGREYLFRYYVQADDGLLKEVVGRDATGRPSFLPYSENVKVDGSTGIYYADSYGMMFYPDPQCQKVEVSIDGRIYTITMRPHPYLNIAYAYWGLNNTIDMVYSGVQGDLDVETEDKTVSSGNRLYMSSLNNPFYFPLAGNKTMGSKVLNAAVANKALSEGQYGLYPLYVFTEDGIWSMDINADGSFRSSHPLSREVCSNPASVTSIDQAVVFMSRKGLMVLSGSQITELSPHMNGRHYTIDATAETIVNGQDGFCDMTDALKDAAPFLMFMSDSRIGYDYAGGRLVCINPHKPYQYVYKMESKTWHKIYHPGYTMRIPLNSYPSCEVSAIDSKGHRVLLDLSSVRDGSMNQHAEKSVVVTRPFSLDEPDVLKTIQDVRIRGPLKGSFLFILQGSQDGVNFYTISTLRGKAWKMFRIIILGDLDIFERISWIDVMYETRFTNKLR